MYVKELKMWLCPETNLMHLINESLNNFLFCCYGVKPVKSNALINFQ